MMLVRTAIDSPLGTLQLVARGDHLVGVYLPSQRPPADAAPGDPAVLRRTAVQLGEYFAGSRRLFDLPVAPTGTTFQLEVWRALATIPYGVTWTYGALGDAIGRPSASRAVGAANGKNPLSIVVPCHRVIGASGGLTGYAGGIAAKRWLLAHERRFACGLQADAARAVVG